MGYVLPVTCDVFVVLRFKRYWVLYVVACPLCLSCLICHMAYGIGYRLLLTYDVCHVS